MIQPKSAVGKPLVLLIEGQKRQIGTITHAAIKDGKLYFASTIEMKDDE